MTSDPAADRRLAAKVAELAELAPKIADAKAAVTALLERKGALLRSMFYDDDLLIPEIVELTTIPTATVRLACQGTTDAERARYSARMADIAHRVHRRRNRRTLPNAD